MQLAGKVVVITRGLSEIGEVLAKGFRRQGAIVVIADANENKLHQKAEEIGAVAIAADLIIKSEVKKLVDKTAQLFGRIDLFVSSASFAEMSCSNLSEKNWNDSYRLNTMSQMYAAKYVLPYMINQKNGYLVNMIPIEGLLKEFRHGMYTTLKHPSLDFAERMAITYKHLGIKVSVLCCDCFEHVENIRLQNFTDSVVKGIDQEQFMICFEENKANSYYKKLYESEMSYAIRA